MLEDKGMMPEKTDTQTIQEQMDREAEQIRQAGKDPDAFRPLYEAYFSKVFRFVLHRVGDKETAGDITQQVFLNALSHIRKFEPRGVPFSAWLFRIAINQVNFFFRTTKRNRVLFVDHTTIEPLYEEIMADQSMDDWLEKLPRILEKLDEEALQLVELRFFEGRPFKEIGGILGITENNAKVKIYRALDKMKKMFIEHGSADKAV